MIDIEKFICSLLEDHPEGITVRSDIHRALKDQGLEYKDGKIVPIEDKESEDEKIRKWCISHFRECFRVTGDNVEYQEYLNNKVIPWLERQGEKKPIVIIPKFRVGDVIRVKGSNAEYRITEISNGYYHGKGWGLDIIKGDESGDYELVKQTPTLSKEDERWFKEIELMCLNFSNDTDYREKFSTWLKSLKDRVGCETNCTTMWKPSREQMKYLHKYAEQNNYDGAILTGLYDDLLKVCNLNK